MSQMNAIPERDQVSVEETWNLTDLYADDAAWQAEFEVAQTYVDKLSAYAGRLGESGATLLEYLELCQEADTLLNNLANYAYRKGDQDTRVAQYQAMEGKISSLAVEINGAIALFYPGVLKKLSESLGEDFYIAFTSIHEAQIHAAGMISPETVEASLRDTNRHCNRREEVLTDRVYCYRKEEQKLGIIEDGEFLEVKRDE